MGMGFGIGALVFTILSIIVPVVSLYVLWLGLILAVLAAFSGDKVFSIASFIIGLVNLVFLSPLSLVAISISSNVKTITVGLFIAIIVGWLVSPSKE
jgi:hypothetical protein